MKHEQASGVPAILVHRRNLRVECCVYSFLDALNKLELVDNHQAALLYFQLLDKNFAMIEDAIQ